MSGRPIRFEVRPSLGPHLAAASIPRRVILLDAGILLRRREFERIVIHEIFHFAWVRLSNANRRSWEAVLAAELRARAPGELGWSAESRKLKLSPSDTRRRTPGWRRYVCESFCDSAAWMYSGAGRHGEFTLARLHRSARRKWFHGMFPATAAVPI